MTGRELPYRPGTGVVLISSENRVFVGQRIDTTIEAWQMPQGGIDPGEDAETAALRELEEEIGTRNVRVLARTRDWLTYDLPEDLVGKVWGGKFRGQKQLWFLMRFLGRDSDINLQTAHPEFRAWKWIPYAEVAKTVVPFKRRVYDRVLAEFRPLMNSGNV